MGINKLGDLFMFKLFWCAQKFWSSI